MKVLLKIHAHNKVLMRVRLEQRDHQVARSLCNLISIRYNIRRSQVGYSFHDLNG